MDQPAPSTPPSPICAATNAVIESLIRSAAKRLVVLAPAVSITVARVIEERWLALGANGVSVTLDVDSEVYRLGYGTDDALQHLESAGRRAGSLLQRQPGIRIGIIVADERILIYSPVPELIEAGPRKGSAPNAVFLSTPVMAIQEAVGFGNGGRVNQTIGLDKATQDEIAEVRKDLQSNPPQKFDVQRTLRVFNAAFQFVELHVRGTSIAQQTVQLPTSLLGIVDEQTRDELRMSLRLVSSSHSLSGRDIAGKRRRIEKRYLKTIGGYGRAIAQKHKPQFLADVRVLETEVEAFGKRVTEELSKAIDAKLKQLVAAFLPRMRKAPPPNWPLPLRGPERAKAVKRCLEEDLRDALGRPADYVEQMSVEYVFKDVTYECLQNTTFADAARSAFKDLPHIHEVFDAAAASVQK